VDDLQSEKEQLEEMRAWWSEYGKVIIAGIVIAVAGLVGYSQYQSAQLATQMEASERFERLVGHIVNGDMDGAEFVADDLVANYADTVYAAQSKLALARLYMDQNRDQDAAEALEQLLAMSADENLQNIGRLRLGSILLYQDKAQDVIDLLQDFDAPGFVAMTNELRGDAYAALGDYKNAADAYNRALADPSPTPTIDSSLVQMKLVDLPDVVVADASQADVVVPQNTDAADDAEDAADAVEDIIEADEVAAEDGASE
jgi:predicted negative regulator of RcsB-dependent stress response